MRFDFSDFPFNARAFSDRPMTFSRLEVSRLLTAVFELTAIETGPSPARVAWQAAQTTNLLKHATERSKFWRDRVGVVRGQKLADLPILRRADLRAQVDQEGALLSSKDRIGTEKHSSSGSSGEPVRFFVSAMNGNYNAVRGIAQYLMEGRNLTLNRTRIKSVRGTIESGYSVERESPWLGALAPFVVSGGSRLIKIARPEIPRVWAELKKEPIGYLAIAPSALEALLQKVAPAELEKAGLAMLILLAEPLDAEIRRRFTEVGVPARETYSCEEVGPIAFECERRPGNFHVATSNVIVETVGEESLTVDGAPIGNVLLTHLHSYATPFIRYEVGDLAALSQKCPCGHDGPTLSNIVGRTKGLLKLSDGGLVRVHIRASDMTEVGPFDEYRIRQTGPAKLVVEIGGRTSLTAIETQRFVDLMKKFGAEGFSIEVIAVAKIDWGRSVKRLGFHNEML
jgi:phenylacetate-CoA ligase